MSGPYGRPLHKWEKAMTAELTEESVAAYIETGRVPMGANADDFILAMAHAALRDVRARGQKPVAWMQTTAYGNKLLSFTVPDRTPAAYTGVNIKTHVFPLYAEPQPTYREGLEAAAKATEAARMPMATVLLRALIDKEKAHD